MLDVEFLLAPVAAPRIIYRYRTDVLQRKLRHVIRAQVKDAGLEFAPCGDTDLESMIRGPFAAGFCFCQTDNDNGQWIEHLMGLAATHETDGVALYVPRHSLAFDGHVWRSLEQRFFVIDEPIIGPTTIAAILNYAVATTDLNPSPDLLSTGLMPAALGAGVADLGELFRFVDDYILLGPDWLLDAEKPGRPRPSEPALRAFLASPTRKTMSDFIGALLSRNADTEAIAHDLLSSAARLLTRAARAGGREVKPMPMPFNALLWAVLLLVRQKAIRRCRPNFATAWRSGADLRVAALHELCVEYKALSRRPNDIAQVLASLSPARRDLHRADAVAATDFKRLWDAASQMSISAHAVAPAKWIADLGQQLGTALPPPVRPAHGGRVTARTFGDYGGHLHHIERLRRMNRRRRTGLALLFVGARNVGKLQLARIQANAMLCSNPKDGEPCLICDECRFFAHSGSARFGYADLDHDVPARQKSVIRRASEMAVVPGLWVEPSVVILDGIDRVAEGALDALLKVVEDAPLDTSFIFLAERLADVPPALRSRSTCFKFQRRSAGQRSQGLE